MEAEVPEGANGAQVILKSTKEAKLNKRKRSAMKAENIFKNIGELKEHIKSSKGANGAQINKTKINI